MSELFDFAYNLALDLLVSGIVRGDQVRAASGCPNEFVDWHKFEGLEVNGVGVDEDESSICLYSSKASKKLESQYPNEIGGYKVEYLRIGNVSYNPDDANKVSSIGHYYEKNGKTACGSSCCPVNYPATGTFGAIVKINGGEKIYALSNNHVFGGCNHINRGHDINSPSQEDYRANSKSATPIFSLHSVVPMYSALPGHVPPMQMDAALAEVKNENSVSTWQGNFYDTPSTPEEPCGTMMVKKVGRTTELTKGIILKRTPLLLVPYKSKYFTGNVYFSDVWLVRPVDCDKFAMPGDSGSLVVNEDNTKAIGLLFAAVKQTGLGFIIPIKKILEKLNCELLSGRT